MIYIKRIKIDIIGNKKGEVKVNEKNYFFLFVIIDPTYVYSYSL